jgi:glutaredoxin
VPVQDVEAPDTQLEIYWVPGCSGCLRMKEFVEKIGVPHEAVNAAIEPERAARLEELGLRVPAAVLGNKGVPGVDLAGIAKLVGYDYDPPEILPAIVLKTKFDEIIGVAIGFIGQLSPEALDYKSPDRDRTLRQLALHIATIMRGFVVAEDTNEYTQGYEFMPDGYAENSTGVELIALAIQARDELGDWWDRIGANDSFERVLDSATGSWTLLEALERSVWHTTQHTRQLQYFLEERIGVTPRVRLTDEMLAGLPLPDGIHAGGEL